MSFSFGNQGDRKKSTKRNRYGQGKGEGPTLHERMTKREMTANQIAVFNLNRELERFPQITKDARRNLKSEMVEMEQLHVMNMKYLAATLVLMFSYQEEEPCARMFTGEVWDMVLEKLVLTSGLSTPESIVKHKEQIVVYIAKVYYYRQGGPRQTTVDVDDINDISDSTNERPQQDEDY